MAKSKQRHNMTLNNFLKHVVNHALKGLYMLNHVTIVRTTCINVPCEVLIDFN